MWYLSVSSTHLTKLPFHKIQPCFTICFVEVEWGHSRLTWTRVQRFVTFCASDADKRACCRSYPVIFLKISSIQHCVLINFSELAPVFLCSNTVWNGACCLKYFKVIVNCCSVSNRHIRKFSSEFMRAFLVRILFWTYVLYKNARCSYLIRIATVDDS